MKDITLTYIFLSNFETTTFRKFQSKTYRTYQLQKWNFLDETVWLTLNVGCRCVHALLSNCWYTIILQTTTETTSKTIRSFFFKTSYFSIKIFNFFHFFSFISYKEKKSKSVSHIMYMVLNLFRNRTVLGKITIVNLHDSVIIHISTEPWRFLRMYPVQNMCYKYLC